MQLFSDNFPNINSDNELELLKAQYFQYDPAYICQAVGGSRQKVKKWMEDLWVQYEPYADSHFLTDFKHQFAQRSWELYLGVAFLNRGFKIGNNSGVGADFDIQDQAGKRIAWIEAIAVRPGDGIDKVPDLIYNTVSSVPVDEMLLRVASALDTKFKKYSEDLKKGLMMKNEPYVIALNRSVLGHVEIPPSLIIKAVFGVGDMTLSFPVPVVGEAPTEKEPTRGWSFLGSVPKKNGQGIPMNFFENPEHSHISAVIYSIDHIINSPREPECIGENFIIVHNPLATNPLTSDVLPFGDEYRVVGDSITKTRDRKVNCPKPDAFADLMEDLE